LAEALGDAAAAAREYEAELARDPQAHRSAFNLAKLLMAAKRPHDAAARLRAALQAQPEFGTGYLYLAKALLDVGDLAGAEQAARGGLARPLEPGTAPLGHYVLADVYARLGRTADARREVAAARRLQRGG
jgi:predicted Zn-dependent protease